MISAAIICNVGVQNVEPLPAGVAAGKRPGHKKRRNVFCTFRLYIFVVVIT